MNQPNGSSPNPDDLEIPPELRAILLQGVATFKTAMSRSGMIASQPEIQIVSDVLFLVARDARKLDAHRVYITLQIVFNFLTEIIVECQPNNRIVRMIKSLQHMLITGERDANIQEHLERMEVRQRQAKAKGELD
jgi:hypothetical protein